MSGSHYAPDPWRYGLEDTIYEMTPVTAVTTPPQSNGAPDLRTGPERDADARAALGEAERTSPSVVSARTEERLSALEDAVHRQAQMLQVLWLEREGGQ